MSTLKKKFPKNKNLLVNPEFRYIPPSPSTSFPGPYLACWNTKKRGDIEILPMKEGFGKTSPGNCVLIHPGKRFWQFRTLCEIGNNLKGNTLRFTAEISQKEPSSVKISLYLMGPESADGTWSPAEFGLEDKRTSSRHGRGELVSVSEKTSYSGRSENETITTEELVIDWNFRHTKESSSKYRNAVGIRVEIENISSSPAWVRWPSLARGKTIPKGLVKGSPVPSYSRQLPRTMEKLLEGKPLHILALGSSLDRGSANPPLYLYDENPLSPDYKKPVPESRRFLPESVGRPDLAGYIGFFQHYFMYTGRTRLELMKKFGHPVSSILLNVMACDGSSIGEGHSGFMEYASFFSKPNPGINGHAEGDSWKALYPGLFKKGNPPPDLVIFGYGSGHNEQIDEPDTIAAYEGAIRLFQRRFPGVEFLSCTWPVKKGKEDIVTGPMEKLCSYYNIPFIDVRELDSRLSQSTNFFALATDGVHFQAGAHYIWFKQLEKAFEIADAGQKWLAQKHLPRRMNPYSYNWEGDHVTFTAPHPRIVEKRMMILEDGAFSLWAFHEAPHSIPPVRTKIRIDGKEMQDAGKGNIFRQRNNRNSSFAYGRLETGKRHVVEVLGTNPQIFAADHKVALNKAFFPAGNRKWNKTVRVENFESGWGAPYGSRCFLLHEGEKIEITAEGTLFSVAYLDEKNGGTFEFHAGGKRKKKIRADIPYVCSEGKSHYIENRDAISANTCVKRKITVRCISGTVRILGLYTYNTR